MKTNKTNTTWFPNIPNINIIPKTIGFVGDTCFPSTAYDWKYFLVDSYWFILQEYLNTARSELQNHSFRVISGVQKNPWKNQVLSGHQKIIPMKKTSFEYDIIPWWKPCWIPHGRGLHRGVCSLDVLLQLISFLSTSRIHRHGSTLKLIMDGCELCVKVMAFPRVLTRILLRYVYCYVGFLETKSEA